MEEVLNEVLAEGKTKQILSIPNDENRVILKAKDDITAGNGARHEKMVGKAELATRTTCNVFNLLKRRGIPVAFDSQSSPTGFFAEKCTMLPFEVVVRSEAHGSYLKRYPAKIKGHKFEQLRVEVFLKTSGKKWKNHDLPCDDPLMFVVRDEIHLFLPDQPMDSQRPFRKMFAVEVFNDESEIELLSQMGRIACRVFSILKEEWAKQGGNMVDFKVEFGLNRKGELRLADVIDNDSWRVVIDEQYVDKQGFRDGEGLDPTLKKYNLVANLTDKFARN